LIRRLYSVALVDGTDEGEHVGVAVEGFTLDIEVGSTVGSIEGKADGTSDGWKVYL